MHGPKSYPVRSRQGIRRFPPIQRRWSTSILATKNGIFIDSPESPGSWAVEMTEWRHSHRLTSPSSRLVLHIYIYISHYKSILQIHPRTCGPQAARDVLLLTPLWVNLGPAGHPKKEQTWKTFSPRNRPAGPAPRVLIPPFRACGYAKGWASPRGSERHRSTVRQVFTETHLGDAPKWPAARPSGCREDEGDEKGAPRDWPDFVQAALQESSGLFNDVYLLIHNMPHTEVNYPGGGVVGFISTVKGRPVFLALPCGATPHRQLGDLLAPLSQSPYLRFGMWIHGDFSCPERDTSMYLDYVHQK